MDYVKEALLGMVRAVRELDELRRAYSLIGISDDSLFKITGYIEDAVYALIMENNGVECDYGDSVTYVTLHDMALSNDKRVEILLNEYQKNNAQPKPNTIENAEMLRMIHEYGGYHHDSQ